MTHKQTATRYEIKLVTQEQHLHEARSWLRLHPMMFHQPYPTRRVNNIYFDTPHLHSLQENYSGVTERKKVRIRWYGDDTGTVNGTLEVKLKRAKLGWKISQLLPEPLSLECGSWNKIVEAIHAQLTEEFRHYLYQASTPVLINRYQREYYLSADGKVRATLDYSEETYDQRCSDRPNLTRATPSPREIVLEFKATADANHPLAKAVSHMPLRVSRCSKYVRGIESLVGT